MTLRFLARGMLDVPDSALWLSPAESARLAGTRFVKRRSELRLSRWTAKCALNRVLGCGPPATVEVRPAPDGAPTPLIGGAPAPVSISLTDRADWAVCLVGPRGTAIGCDLELVEPRSAPFVRDWCTPREQALVADGEHDLVANVVWSAKESALKVLRTGLRRPARSVEIDLDATADGTQWTRCAARLAEGGVLPGWWRRYGEFVLTVAADRACGPPAELDDPSRLATAVPSHRWLTATLASAPSPAPPQPRGTGAAPPP